MITLQDELLVGKGFHRICYRHPENPKLCIKVQSEANTKERAREQRYYLSLQQRQIDWRMLSRYYGEINTNLGQGDVFQLITDDNDQPSKTLDYYLGQEYSNELKNILNNLRSYLLQQQIITTELKPRNIVCQKQAGTLVNAVVIDDIGNSEFIPVSNFITTFAKRKIMRKWKRFEDNIAARGLRL